MCLHTFLALSQTTFQKTFGGLGNESANWVVEALNGFVIAGQVTNAVGNQDALLVRMDATGNAVWQKRFGAAQAETFNSVMSTQDGGFIAVGETKSFGAGNKDVFIVKVDANGAVLWSRTVGDAEHDEVAKSIVGIPGGGFLVSGYSMYTFDTAPNSVFFRLDQDGNTVWSRTYTSGVGNLLSSTYILNNVILASGGADGDGVLVRLDLNDGHVLSTFGYAANGSEALYCQQPTEDGNLLLADHTHSATTGEDIEMWVQKVNPVSGQVLWSKVYYRKNDNIRGRIEKVNDGGFLLVPSDNFNTTQAEALLAKIDADGNLLWSYNYGGNASDRLLRAVQTMDGGFLAVGDTKSASLTGNTDILIIKTDGSGRIQGRCATDAGIKTALFSTTNPGLQTSDSPWHQAKAFNTNPLPVSLLAQNFTLNIAPTILQTVPLCPNKSITINGMQHFAPKMVSDTVSGLNGCDTIFNYNLLLSPFDMGIHVIGLCDGETFTVDGVQYTAPATLTDTIPSLTGGCDTLCTFVLKAWSQPTAAQTISFCAGESVMIGGQLYSQPGTVQASIPSLTTGCDTLVTYTLIERPVPTRSTTIAFCPGESVIIGGNNYSQSGTVYSSIPSNTPNSCDTLVTYTLELKPQPTRSEYRSFCPGESVSIDGQTYTQSATVVSNIASTTTGCDTVVTYTLELRPQPSRSETLGLCPGESVVIAGQIYNQPGTVIASVNATYGGCDTIVTYTLEARPQPTRAETRGFCPGETVVIAGQSYNQPGSVIAEVKSTTGGCDTIVTYTLELRPQPSRSETLSFCPGESVTIAGQTYTQAGTVLANLKSTTGGCDTAVTYTLQLLPQASRAETRGFCPGESVLINGQNYTQPGIVVQNLPSALGCDTVVTYTLQYLTPAPSNIAVSCPKNMVMVTEPGEILMPVTYTDPQAASDCVCPGLELNRTQGLASGSMFPIGITQVCYTIKDNCGQEKNCCFSVEIKEETPCDVKEIACMKYELLSVTEDAGRNRTYRIRVTNECANKLVYTAIQIPDGITTLAPANNSTYLSPQERNYIVRSPNFTPMYSIRFKSTTDSISNGQSDIFEYTLPAQVEVTYINITSRLASQLSYEAHLNTYNCPVGITPINRSVKTKFRDAETVETENSLLLFPNPTTGVLFADLSDWQGQKLQIQVTNAQGQLVHSMKLVADEDLLRVELPQTAGSGVYFLEVTGEKGNKETMRFILKR